MTDNERLDVAWELNARLSMDLTRGDLRGAALTVLKLRLLLHEPEPGAPALPAPVVADVPRHFTDTEKET